MPTEATAPVINLESLRETYIQMCYTATQTRLPKKLTREDLLKRLRWHNQAMPFIHTIPSRPCARSRNATHDKPSAALSVFWHLGYVYDPDPDHGWLTTPQLVLRTRLHPTTFREIQRRYPEFIDTKRDRFGSGDHRIQVAPHGRVRRFKLILPTTWEFNSPPLWMVDDEERRYHVTMMEETIPALDLDPRPNLLMQMLLYHSVQRRCALSYQESGLLFKNDGEMMTKVRDKLHEEKQCLSWDLPQKRGEAGTPQRAARTSQGCGDRFP